jgi:hypothetical protein
MFNVDKKLREAQFFLEKMRERERMAFGDPEVFDFLLSAFLNAVRTVDYRLCHEQKRTYPDWRVKTWNVANPMEDSRDVARGHSDRCRDIGAFRGAAVHREADRAGVDVRRPGCDRDRERAAIRRNPGQEQAAG